MSGCRPPLAALLLALLLTAAACGTPAGGDPGGHRLAELGSDPVFTAPPPPGATSFGIRRTPATYQQPGFESGGWHGPGVVVSFTSGASPADVYGFYAQQAQAAGWRPTASGALKLTDRWAKTYPDGAKATLLLSLLDLSQTATQRRYMLSGGIEPLPG